MTDKRGRPIISIETVACERGTGHNGEEVKCASLDIHATMALSYCATRFIETIGENLAHRLEVIKIRPQMTSSRISTVQVEVIFGDFYYQKRLQCYTFLRAPSFNIWVVNRDILDKFSSEFTRKLTERLKDHMQELAESFGSAKADADRALREISALSVK